jgi:hypothetical protein
MVSTNQNLKISSLPFLFEIDEINYKNSIFFQLSVKSLILILLMFNSSFSVSANAMMLKPLPAPPFLTPSAPVIDGVLDEQFHQGLLFDSFRQVAPVLFSDATVRTEIYFMYDQENIYIAGNVYQKKESIKASAGKRDSMIISEGDFITIAIDAMHTKSSAVFFSVNPFNAILDGTTDGDKWDFSWDGIFQTATKIYDDRWVFELQLPLSSINFQNKQEQNWGIMVYRNYAYGQERLLNQITDKNNPLRIADFFELKGLKNLRLQNKFKVTPYNFHSYSNDAISTENINSVKVGGEFFYKPVSSISLLTTINPDFAQIEADKVIVNVNDVPVSLTEKRPFFTESSDMYPGLAVNTRNINEIKAGLKMRHLVDNLKYDLTYVHDNDNSNWFLGNAKWSNNRTLKAEIISGLKSNEAANHYNITTNVQMWAFNRKFTAYNWYGIINNPTGGNEFETVNSIKWETREFKTGLWSQYKSQFYNPNIVGHNTLSNETKFSGWINYIFNNQFKFMPRLSSKITFDRYNLSTNSERFYYFLNYELKTQIHLGKIMGNWGFTMNYQPGSENFFRNRNIDTFNDSTTYSDSYSNFQLVNQNRAMLSFNFNTDNSKTFGLSLFFQSHEIRQSKAISYRGEASWKIAPKTNLIYSVEGIDLGESNYQNRYLQQVHLVKFEYNFTDKINLKILVQLNESEIKRETPEFTSSPLYNLTASWEYMKGSFVYVVFNKYNLNRKSSVSQYELLADNQFAAIKINRTFNF